MKYRAEVSLSGDRVRVYRATPQDVWRLAFETEEGALVESQAEDLAQAINEGRTLASLLMMGVCW